MVESVGEVLVFLLELFGWTVDSTREPAKPPRDVKTPTRGNAAKDSDKRRAHTINSRGVRETRQTPMIAVSE